MDTMTRKLAKRATIEVGMGRSEYGTAQPQIELRFPQGTHYRTLQAALHAVAAEIELATPATAHWCVQTEVGDVSGRVYLELAEGNTEEARCGLALLRRMLG